MFIRALANYLGALISMPLSGDKALARQAFQIADATARAAQAANANEDGPTIQESTPDWISVRGYEADMGQTYSPYVQAPTNLVFIT
jgi:hypothetical protein